MRETHTHTQRDNFRTTVTKIKEREKCQPIMLLGAHGKGRQLQVVTGGLVFDLRAADGGNGWGCRLPWSRARLLVFEHTQELERGRIGTGKDWNREGPEQERIGTEDWNEGNIGTELGTARVSAGRRARCRGEERDSGHWVTWTVAVDLRACDLEKVGW